MARTDGVAVVNELPSAYIYDKNRFAPCTNSPHVTRVVVTTLRRL